MTTLNMRVMEHDGDGGTPDDVQSSPTPTPPVLAPRVYHWKIFVTSLYRKQSPYGTRLVAQSKLTPPQSKEKALSETLCRLPSIIIIVVVVIIIMALPGRRRWDHHCRCISINLNLVWARRQKDRDTKYLIMFLSVETTWAVKTSYGTTESPR